MNGHQPDPDPVVRGLAGGEVWVVEPGGYEPGICGVYDGAESAMAHWPGDWRRDDFGTRWLRHQPDTFIGGLELYQTIMCGRPDQDTPPDALGDGYAVELPLNPG